MSAGLPEPARREHVAAGDLQAPPIRPLRILSRLLPASFSALACTAFPADFLRTGQRTSLFRLVSQWIVVFLFVLRKDAVSLSRRP